MADIPGNLKMEAEINQEKLQTLQDFALQSLQEGKELVIEQSPLVVQEMLNWGIASSGFWIAHSLFFIIISYILLKFSNKIPEHIEVRTPCQCISVCIGMFSVFIALTNVYTILFIIYAPRLYILKELSKLLKD